MIKALLRRGKGHSLEEKIEGLICIKSEKETALFISKKDLFRGIRRKYYAPPPLRLECRLFSLSKYNPNKSDTSNLSKHPYTCSQHGTEDRIQSRARHIYVVIYFFIPHTVNQNNARSIISGLILYILTVHNKYSGDRYTLTVHNCTHLKIGAINIFFLFLFFTLMYTSIYMLQASWLWYKLKQ